MRIGGRSLPTGFGARAETDPEFDSRMFFAAGRRSFDPDIVSAASQPMLCGRGADDYRAYLPAAARWIRDANDSYFAAMTYPQALPSSSQPADIHTPPGACLSASLMAAPCTPPAKATPPMADAAVLRPSAVLALDAGGAGITVRPWSRRGPCRRNSR